MPKTKEKSAKSSAKASAKSSTRVTAAKPAAKASGKSSTKLPTQGSSAKAKTGSGRIVKPATGATTKPGTGATTKPASGSIAKPAAKAASASSTKLPAATNGTAAKPANGSSRLAAASSKAITIAKPTALPRPAAEKPVERPAANLKSPFNRDELTKWREQLLQRRNEISSDIAGLEKDAMEAEDGHTTPNHIAERGSDADLQDVSLGIAGEEKDVIWQIDRALRKIDQSSPLPFGLCEYTKEPISRNRLQLIPWTPLSIEGANYMEENGLKVEDLLVDG
jgi:DnaK suppressor protein